MIAKLEVDAEYYNLSWQGVNMLIESERIASGYKQNEMERMYRLRREGSLGPDLGIIPTFKDKVGWIN